MLEYFNKSYFDVQGIYQFAEFVLLNSILCFV